MDLLIDAEDCRIHSFATGCKIFGTLISSWDSFVGEEESIDAKPYFHRNVEEVADVQFFAMSGAKLNSMGLPLEALVTLETTR